MNEMSPLIGVLDDEPQMCKALCRLLKTHNFRVVTFEPCIEFFALCSSQPPDCLLLDLNMPGINGIDVLEYFSAQNIGVPVIVITALDAPGSAERVRALGAVEYLLKPLNESQLVEAIRKAIDARASI